MTFPSGAGYGRTVSVVPPARGAGTTTAGRPPRPRSGQTTSPATHTALLDADFRAYDGLDSDDADQMGFDLDEVAPPDGIDGADEDELRALMTLRLTPRQ